MDNKKQPGVGLGLLLLGIAIAACSVWLYYRIAAAEAQGLHYRFHSGFYALYRMAGKGITCMLIGLTGIAIAVLGLKRLRQ